MFLPFLIGLVYLLGFGELEILWKWLTSFPCLLLSISAHLVGLSFCYAFRHHEVKQVIIKSKLPELVLPLFSLLPIFTTKFSADLKTIIPLIITWIGILPLYIRDKKKLNLFDKTTVFISGSLLLQMLFSAHISVPTMSLTEKVGFTTAMLLWRSIFTLPFCLKYMNKKSEKLTFLIAMVIIIRALASFATQLTFTWSVLEGNPLFIWPILTLTPLVATMASHLILNEKIHLLELFALSSFFIGTMIALII